jgi:polyisoprenoid-binding protein YceI
MESSIAEQTTWVIDKSHTHLNFTIAHFMIAKVAGHFADFSGTFTTADADFSGAEIALTIQAASINTNDSNRDAHLRTPDFFDVASHPEIRFVSTAFTGTGNNQYRIEGLLTVNGVEKALTLDAVYNGQFEHPMSKNTIAVFEANANINRLDFNIGVSYPAAALGEVVKLNSILELTRQA